MPMTPRTLGKTNIQVSPLGFGAAPAAYLKPEQDATGKLLNDLLDRGLNLIDTATSYPGSEEFIGQYVGHRRKDFTLVSKCGGATADGTSGEKWSPELISTSVDRSLRLMKTDHLDVMLLHTCDFDTLKNGEALGALIAARDAGKVRFIGYSGDNEAAGYACTLRDVAVVETSLNYADQANIDQVLPAARANNVGIIAKRPVANAAWLGATGRGGFYDKYASEYVKRQAAMGITPEEFGFTAEQWAEFAIRFVLGLPEVSTAIVGTTNPKNALRNIEYAEKGGLDGATVERIRAKFHAAPGSASWTGQT